MMHQIHIHMQQCSDYMRYINRYRCHGPRAAGFVQFTELCADDRFSVGQTSYRKPVVRTKFGEHALSYSGPAAWNSLPPCLQSTTNNNSFKRQLKARLFTETF